MKQQIRLILRKFCKLASQAPNVADSAIPLAALKLIGFRTTSALRVWTCVPQPTPLQPKLQSQFILLLLLLQMKRLK